MPIHKKRLSILLLIICLFWTPFLAAWYLFRHPDFLTIHTVNHGKLLQPPVPLTHLGVAPLSVTNLTKLRNKWLLIYAPTLPCQATCQTLIKQQRQVWLALNKNRQQVQRIVLAAPNNLQFARWLAQAYPDVIWLPVNMTQLKQFEQQLSATKLTNNTWIFIADPNKNVMLYYSESFIEKNLYDDLMRLLNTTQA